MATHVWASAVVNAPISEVWGAIRPLDFTFVPEIKEVLIDDGASSSSVGSIRTVYYTDGTVQKIKLISLSDTHHKISWELVDSKPAVDVLSSIHIVKCHRVTHDNTTFVEKEVHFSSDATPTVLQDALWKSKEFFVALSRASNSGEFFAQPYRELQNYFESKEFHKAAKEMFREYDVDSSGYLDAQEVLPILLEVWEQRKDLFKKNNLAKPTKQYAEAQLKRFDTNKNGKLEEDEFVRFIKVTYAQLSREANS